MAAILAEASSLSREDREALLALMAERDRREKRRRFYHLFPAETHTWRGEKFFARSHYGPHINFIAATDRYREVAMMAANRIGKTEVGAYCVSTWLTGRYQSWWPGRRWKRPVKVWCAGDTNETVRDILQRKLLGPVEWSAGRRVIAGTGIIPGDAIDDARATWRNGVPDMLDTISVRHESGDFSTLAFKSYQQGRVSFQGTEQDVVWLDEEPPMEIYTETLTRLATTDGLLIATFTPLRGLSDVALQFVDDDMTRG